MGNDSGDDLFNMMAFLAKKFAAGFMVTSGAIFALFAFDGVMSAVIYALARQ